MSAALQTAATAIARVEFLADRSDAIPVVANWLCDAWPEATGNDPTAVARRLCGWCHRRVLPLGLVGCNPQGGLLGFAALRRGTSPQGEPVTLLSALFVAPWARRRGTGRALCAASREHAARLGLSAMHLYTTDAEAFFRRLDWRFVCHAITGSQARPRAAAFMQTAVDDDHGG